MEKISLNGVWSLYYAPEKQLPETPEALALSDIGRVEATVPGNVELDLFRAGVCPDPFFGENLYEFRKYERCSSAGWIPLPMFMSTALRRLRRIT